MGLYETAHIIRYFPPIPAQPERHAAEVPGQADGRQDRGGKHLFSERGRTSFVCLSPHVCISWNSQGWPRIRTLPQQLF
jgi:hypothetical protein